MKKVELKCFEVGKLYYAAKIIVENMTIEKMDSYDAVGIYKIENIWRGNVYYSRWIYSKGVITRDEKFYSRFQKSKGIVGHQWGICYAANCQRVSKSGFLYAINECTLLKVAENGEIVIAETSTENNAVDSIETVNAENNAEIPIPISTSLIVLPVPAMCTTIIVASAAPKNAPT